MKELDLPPLILGTMDRRQCADEERAELFVEAFEVGFRAFDTAPLYEFGCAEKQLGKALASVPRDDALVLTKVGLRWDNDGHGDILFQYTGDSGSPGCVRKDARPDSIIEEVNGSLERLCIDRLDLVQIHHPDRHVPIAESMGALLDLKREGKLRHIGVSNFSVEEIAAAQEALGDVSLATVQQDYSLVKRDIEHRLIPLCRDQRIDIIVYSPLGEGLLAGKPAPSPHEAFQRIAANVHEVMAPIATRQNVSIAAVALAWVTGQPGISSAITGASTRQQLLEQAQAMHVDLQKDERARLTDAFANSPLPLAWELEDGGLKRLVRYGKRGVGSVMRKMGIDPGKLRNRIGIRSG